MNAEELKARSKQMALDIIKLVEKLSKGQTTDVIGRQLIRSATSVAANYRSACRSRSRSDFINKLGIVEEESDETLLWLEMLLEAKKVNEIDVVLLMKEAKELTAIFSASRITAKRNHRQ